MEQNSAELGTYSDVSHRASSVVIILRNLWGDEMPTSIDPVHTVMTDAVSVDDEHGRDDGLVVQGDGLTVSVLYQLLRSHAPVQERLLLLPPELAQRLAAQVTESSIRSALDASTQMTPKED